MKKSLIALAAASAFAAPAFAATSNVDVYGLMHFAVEDTDATNVDMAVVDRVSRFGLKGSEDLGGGLKATWQIEYQLNATNTDSLKTTFTTTGGSTFKLDVKVAQNTLRNTYVGLAGGFGEVRVGRHDTPYKMSTGSLDPFADTLADVNGMPDGVKLIDSTHDMRAPQTVAYISPNLNGFQVSAAVAMTNTDANYNSGDSTDGVSLAATYSNGPLFLSAGFQKLETIKLGTYTGFDSDAWKLGVGYAFGDTKVGVMYENVDGYSASTANLEKNSWVLNATHTMGPIVLKAQYGTVDRDTSATTSVDEKGYALGLDYNLSKRTTAYVLFANGDDDSNATNSGDVSGWAVGMKHSF